MDGISNHGCEWVQERESVIDRADLPLDAASGHLSRASAPAGEGRWVGGRGALQPPPSLPGWPAALRPIIAHSPITDHRARAGELFEDYSSSGDRTVKER